MGWFRRLLRRPTRAESVATRAGERTALSEWESEGGSLSGGPRKSSQDASSGQVAKDEAASAGGNHAEV
jgi:hypothetical protein